METNQYLAHYKPSSMTQAQYQEILHHLMESNVELCLWHVCIGTGDDLEVIDMWDSLDKMHRFQDVLFPILDKVGVSCERPTPQPVVNYMDAKSAVPA